MGLLEELGTLGVNIEEGTKRLMGNAALYEKMMGTFHKMMADSSIRAEEFDCEDCTPLIEKTHAIKGASGNLSITPVYEAYTEIVALLRKGEPAKAKEVFENVLPVQTEIINCIQKYKGQ